MGIIFKFNNYIFNSFREFFVYHYGSLSFRAKVFALVISANENPKVENFIIVREISMMIYKNDEKRADILKLATKEIVDRIKDKTLTHDSLVLKIQDELKKTPRYANKIEINSLREFLSLAHDEDTISYQKNILEFLQTLKNETLLKKKKNSKNLFEKECH